MKNQLNYLEHIGKLTFAYYEAEYKRVKARDARAIARHDHQCTNECYDFESDNVKPFPCYLDVNLKTNAWCDGCKFVQPYWITYREAAEKTRKAKYKLTRKIKSLVKQGYKY
jgi:transposase